MLVAPHALKESYVIGPRDAATTWPFFVCCCAGAVLADVSRGIRGTWLRVCAHGLPTPGRAQPKPRGASHV